jgi:MFS family permease
LSIFLLGISVWIRLQMNEIAGLPEDEGRRQGTPRRRSPKPSASGRTLKIALIALLGLVAGQAVVWYTGQFYALVLPAVRSSRSTASRPMCLIAWSLILGTGGFVFFGSLSDKIGRKPVILGGCLIGAGTISRCSRC